jgi:hypothetical protein
MALEGELKP